MAGHDVEIAYRIRIEDTLFWILEHRTPLRDELDHIIAYQSVVQDITQLKHQEERIFQLAMHDPVTGLPNRSLVLEQLQHWIDTYECFSVFTVSYNLLRSINHDFGYKIGDRWLTQTATRLLHHLSKETYVGHLYGDEYIVLLPHLVSESDIEHVCQTFLRSSKEKIAVDSYEWYPSMTIGVSRYPEDASQPDELIKATNIALGRAKTNSYSVYSSTYNIETYRRHQLQNSLRTAIRRDELFLEYQPKVNAWSGIIVGAEALVRWQHPEWGRIPPNDFIPLSEESDMHILIADWVLEETCRSINQWVLAGLPAVPVSINVSPKRLMYGNFAETVKETLRRFDISPGMLEIEILETDVLFDNAKIHQSLEMLSAMGIRIALDDFGKGYSSISYLQQYPIDTIKIDRQFATSLAHDKKTQSVVRSVLFMANEFGMDVIAEGVETMEQLHYLRQLDCTTIQGYLFSRPLPKADFESALKERQVSAVEAMSVTAHQLTVTASITIHRLKGKQIHVGYTDILISKGTLHSVSFYSSLHLPIHEEIELALKIDDHIIIIQPTQSFELENGLTEYECLGL
ncbi:bifunctional diguanylate cyclase/phosphodiesterase [Exiguobacterium sp. SL14]|nr:bifunctional diguanylate cyclase/phosphodiesterase [Exiguobacterium sp. SL14]MCY1689802.1 bifunctional diguanylate cyclase/phosphodiesterase [Exiguobacterium sp. SL14]